MRSRSNELLHQNFEKVLDDLILEVTSQLTRRKNFSLFARKKELKSAILS